MLNFPSSRETWWKIEDALVWIAAPDQVDLYDPYELTPFNGWAFFEGFYQIRDALLAGKLVGHGSMDAGLVSSIEPAAWTGFQLVPIWDGRSSYPTTIIARSKSTYQARIVRDPREPCGEPVVGNAARRQLHRFITEIVIERKAIVRHWANYRRNPTRRPRKKRALHLKIVETLPRLKWKGASIADSHGNASVAQIGRLLRQHWIEEGDDTYWEEATVRKSLERYYKGKKDAAPPTNAVRSLRGS